MPILLAFAILAAGAAGASPQEPDGKVKWVGEMRTVMKKGDVSARLPLKDLANLSHLYALGPLERLAGEVTVWDGKPSIARVKDGKVRVTTGFDEKACFLVYAQVSDWQEVAIPAAVQGGAELERFIARSARDRGINMKEPFAFLVKGTPKRVSFHILDGAGLDPKAPGFRERAKIRFTLDSRPVEIIGFYSDKHHGVFTHHDSNVHMHLKSLDGALSGHLDEVQFGSGATLYLPKAK
jgi:acetolactate decarboxylase